MILNIFSSLIKDTVLSGSMCKYKVSKFEYKAHGTDVICEVLKNGSFLKLSLSDIITNKLRFFKASDILLLANKFNEIETKDSNNRKSNPNYYFSLSVAFTVLLILSNLGATKITNFFGIALDGGTILFPLLYIISDILTEVYGFSASRRVIWIAFFYNVLFSAFVYLLIILPPSEYWLGQESFETIFSVSPRIVIASISSYLLGEFLNTTIIAYGKIKFAGEYFAIRAIFSTFVGSLLESILFSCIAFWGVVPVNQLIKMVLILAMIKVLYEVIFMPITARVVIFLKQREGVNVFEEPSLKGFFPKLF